MVFFIFKKSPGKYYLNLKLLNELKNKCGLKKENTDPNWKILVNQLNLFVSVR